MDHLLFQKAKPFQGSIRVPLFLTGPSRFLGDFRGTRQELRELRDVMPTLLELAGAPIPETVDGISLLRPSGREYLHGEHAMGGDSMHYIVTERDKFIWYSQTGRELYFDLEQDPRETRNLIYWPECRQRIRQLRAILARELADREEGCSDGQHLIVGKPAVTVLQHT